MSPTRQFVELPSTAFLALRSDRAALPEKALPEASLLQDVIEDMA